MDYNDHHITMEQLCDIIELLCPCMDDFLYVYDFKKDYYFISPDAMQRFALPDYHFHDVMKTHESFVYKEDLPMLLEDLAAVGRGEKTFHNLHYRWLDKENQPIWVNCRGKSIQDVDGMPLYMVGCINEIGAKQKADNVSGVLGERSFQNYFGGFEERIPEGFILHIGIDDFKDINENQGMEYGDYTLRKTAECIAASICPGQKLYRVVADEFMIIDFMGRTTKDADIVYQRIRQEIDNFIERNCYEVVFTISGGILSTKDVKDGSFSTMMRLSEYILNEAKRNGKNRCQIFDEYSYNKFLRKKRLTREMRNSVYHSYHGFQVFFQPIVKGAENELIGAEALLRFESPSMGAIGPVEFIPLLEETGLIIPVGKWVLQEALSVCKGYQQYIPKFRMSVNLSYVQVMKSRVFNDIMTVVNQYGLEPSNVVVELTESGFLETNPHLIKLWENLKKQGINLAIDDFGTGYSNLHCLSDLYPNMVKIDRSFTARALNSDYEYNMLLHVIEMVHSIGLEICIEGIETIGELQQISMLKPDYIQGYFFGRPCIQAVFFSSYIEKLQKST
ncbi:MAG: EAL domain-containing protein [Lachnospiraceae bacterium]